LPVLGTLSGSKSRARAFAGTGSFISLSCALFLTAAGASLLAPHFHNTQTAFAAAHEAWWSLVRYIQ
jgi:hypothetical protein